MNTVDELISFNELLYAKTKSDEALQQVFGSYIRKGSYDKQKEVISKT